MAGLFAAEGMDLRRLLIKFDKLNNYGYRRKKAKFNAHGRRC